MPDLPRDLPPAGSDPFDSGLADDALRARLGRSADAVSGGPWVDGDPRTEQALAATLAHTSRRRQGRWLSVVLPVAAALVVVLALAGVVMTNRDDAVSVGAGGDSIPALGGDGPGGTAAPGTTARGTTVPASTTVPSDAVPPTTVVDPSAPPSPTTIRPSTPGVTSSTPGGPADDPFVPDAPDTPDTTSTTAPPNGVVTAELVPHATSVRVGDRLLVDVVVHNRLDTEIGYTRGSSSCPSFGQVVAGLTDGHELPVDYLGNPQPGVGAKMADLVANANQLTATWLARPPAELEHKDANDGASPICTADLGTGHIAAGQTERTTLAFDADVPPGALPRTSVAIDLTFPYWAGDFVLDPGDGTGSRVTAHASVELVDDPNREVSLQQAYDEIDADSRVRGILDATPSQTYLVWAGYHRGHLVFRAIPFLLAGGPGGPGLYVEADPATGHVLVVRATSQP